MECSNKAGDMIIGGPSVWGEYCVSTFGGEPVSYVWFVEPSKGDWQLEGTWERVHIYVTHESISPVIHCRRIV